MRRAVTLALCSSLLVLALPATAGAHTMSLSKAKLEAKRYAQRAVPGADAYASGSCSRVSAHGFRCSIAAQRSGQTCGNRVLVRYASSTSYRVRVSELGNAVCQ